jgi:DNA-binding NtrC family response regulator
VTTSTKVLIVEDSLALCEMIREVLIAEGLEACGITHSEQEAANLREQRVDAAFLDEPEDFPRGLAGFANSGGVYRAYRCLWPQ